MKGHLHKLLSFLKSLKKYILIGVLLLSPIIYSYILSYYEIIELSQINDTVTSYILLIGFSLAIIVILSNFQILHSNYVLHIIERIPQEIPFSKNLKHYLLSLIKKNHKIIVFIRTLNNDNKEWVLNQIAAYNRIHNENLIIKDAEIEYVFIDEIDTAIHEYVSHLQTSKYDYILITSLSKIFKHAIQVRQELSIEQQKCIKIIGALSSISSDIQEIIDIDENIIRIFPPDYDEAKTAMEFLMSKIKSSFCINKKCTHYHQPTNIIVIHNGTYGAAVKDQAKIAYEEELKKFFHNTNPAIRPIDIEGSINFHSFDYKSDGKLVYDQIDNTDIEPFFEKWKDSMNYFYIVGYEPNISHILYVLNKKLENYNIHSKCLMFCGTLSMTTWRNSVKSSLSELENLKDTTHNAYYLKLQTSPTKQVPLSKENRKLSITLKHHIEGNRLKEVNLEDELIKVLDYKTSDQIKDYLTSYWQRDENYVGIFSKLSMHIAKHSIEDKESLLRSKSKILFSYKKDIKILVNGDSINHYRCVLLNEN